MRDRLPINQVIQGDCIAVMKSFPAKTVNMVMFSPPYLGQRDYGVTGQIGLESHPSLYIEKMLEVCAQIKRVLKTAGSFYLNIGDKYYSSDFSATPWMKPKQLMLMPSRLAIKLQENGWILRNDIIWHKPNHMPEAVKDRLTSSYEHIFHFVKSRKYYYDLDSIRVAPSQSEWKRRMREKQSGKVTRYKNQKIDKLRFPPSQKSGLRTNIRSDTYLFKGKNPGDVLSRGFKKKKGAPFPAAHFLDQHHGYDIIDHPKGKNPGDLIQAFRGNPPTNWRKMGSHDQGKNPGDFWSVPTKPFPGSHFSVYPERICINPIKSSCPAQICKSCGKSILKEIKPTKLLRDGRMDFEIKKIMCNCNKGFQPGIVLDPMCGSGTTLIVAHKLGRRWIGIELKREFVEMAQKRLMRAGAFSRRIDQYMGDSRI